QPGDVLNTCADVSALENLTGFGPQVTLEEGLERFVDWFQSYYQDPPHLDSVTYSTAEPQRRSMS
ncbi:UDP-glucuronate 5-epimerase, partial [Pseudomonas protegens]